MIDGELYVLQAGKGGNIYYIGQEELEVVQITEDKLIFDVKSKFFTDDGMNNNPGLGREELASYDVPKSDYYTERNKFVLIKENGEFKISEIVVPY